MSTNGCLLNDNLTQRSIVTVDLANATVNNAMTANYPTGFTRNNCYVEGIIAVANTTNSNNAYSADISAYVVVANGQNIAVTPKTNVFIGAGAAVKVVLRKL
jgi:hypothetical protein